MSLSKEYSIYCLSLEHGWIKTKCKFDCAREEIIADNPCDILLEIRFDTVCTYPSNIHKDETILLKSDKTSQITEALKKHGDRPHSPYI